MILIYIPLEARDARVETIHKWQHIVEWLCTVSWNLIEVPAVAPLPTRGISL